jgi:hypothetical protein
MKDKFIWNARGNGSIRASKIRNFTICEEEGVFLVIAWVNDHESIKMGIKNTEAEAKEYLIGLHKEILEEIDG